MKSGNVVWQHSGILPDADANYSWDFVCIVGLTTLLGSYQMQMLTIVRICSGNNAIPIVVMVKMQILFILVD